MQHTHPNILSTSTLSGDGVINAAGEDLGHIKDFMIDLDTGRIVYAVLSFGGVMGMGDKLFAIPWDELRVDTDRRRFVLDVDRTRLENAPGFDKNDWPSHADYSFIDRVYTHYGYEAYSASRPSHLDAFRTTRRNRIDRAPTATSSDREAYLARKRQADETTTMDVIDSNRDGV